MSTAHGWKLPAGVTPVAAVILALAALVVIILLARAVGRLARVASAAAAPAPAPNSGGGGKKLLLLAAVAVGGWVLWDRHEATAATAKAAPGPAPAPAPTPTSPPQVITRTNTVLKDIPVHNWPVSGPEIVLIVAVLAVAAFMIVRAVGRYFAK